MTYNLPTGCGACDNPLCSTHGCQKYRHQPTYSARPQGCICPPTSEQTCLNDRCPRKPWKPYTMTTTTEPRT